MARNFNYPSWAVFKLDRSSHQPLHVQIFEQFRDAIIQARIAREHRLPPSRMLAAELGVSRNTVVLVYERLVEEGYATSVTSVGTFVSKVLPEDMKPPPGMTYATDASDAGMPRRRLSARGQSLADMALPSERLSTYDLSPTVPALDELPFDQFARVSAQYWRSNPTNELGYGASAGLPNLRRQIAAYVGEAHGIACHPEQILMTSGVTQSLMLTSCVLADPGDRVLIEDPCYLTRIAALRTTGLDLVPMPIDALGLDAAQFGAAGQTARMVIASPTNQFPFGSTMSMERRLSLLDWARRQDAWVVEYDFSNCFYFNEPPLPSLAALEGGKRVIYIGNFNRSIAPALNLAYIIIPEELIPVFSKACLMLSIQAPHPLQGVLAEFMESGQMAAHIRRMGGRYRERAALMRNYLHTLLGEDFTLSQTQSGLHLAIWPHAPVNDKRISEQCKTHMLDVPALSSYSLGNKAVTGFCLGFGSTAIERIGPAIHTFADIVAEHSAPA
ncbi:MAG: PLP-dependent aminotransferase family protein [Candidimonas sp.]